MFCHKCGARIESNSKFCGSCGAHVGASTAAVTSPAPAAARTNAAYGATRGGGSFQAAGYDPMDSAFQPKTRPNTAGTTAQMPQVSAAATYDAATTGTGKGKRTGLVIGIVLAAVLVLGGGGAAAWALVLQPQQQAAQAQEQEQEQAVEYKVIFETDGGSTVDAITYAEGDDPITTPQTTREGYDFTGWYSKPSCKEKSKVDFPLTPTQDMTLYAGWEKEETTSDEVDVDVNINGAHGAGTVAKGSSTLSATEARATMNEFLYDVLEPADSQVATYASDEFNMRYYDGKSEVAALQVELDSLRSSVYSSLYSDSGECYPALWNVPAQYQDEQEELVEACSCLITRIDAMDTALSIISNMSSSASKKQIDAAIDSALDTGHDARVDFDELIESLEASL